MANTYIIEIGLNDSLQDVIRKCNQNFRQVLSSQQKQSRTEIRQEGIKTEAKSEAMINSAIKEINETVEAGLQLIESKLTQMRADLVPPIGTWIYCDYDPNVIYQDTTWEKAEEGNILITSGKVYTSGEQYQLSFNTSDDEDNQDILHLLSLPLWHRTE